MTGVIDQWLQLGELAELFGFERRVDQATGQKASFSAAMADSYATPGVLESEFLRWLKAQPLVGHAVRVKKVTRSRR